MNAEFQEEARRLEQVSRRLRQGCITCKSKSNQCGKLRRSLTLRNAQGVTGNSVLDSWSAGRQDVIMRGGGHGQPVQDPMIYPGLYAPSGFDMMGILVSF